jgi:AmmeMemoRadiSam system protein B
MITNIREPVVAGMFYDFDKANLRESLKALFKNVPKGNYRCVISPHAGYVYSGKTAAYAINGLKETKRFLILGPNHNVIGYDFSIMRNGIWRTPLGDCKVDEKLANDLKTDILREDFSAHQFEHSIEVQLPFLQYRFKEFSFVPISIKNINYSERFLSNCEKLGNDITSLLKKNPDVCVIASSDFSHYLPQKIADEKDRKAIEKIIKLDTKGFFKVLTETKASICGYGGIAVVMQIAKELNLKPNIIHKSSSGDVTRDFDSVVAYYAIGFG